MSNLVFHGHSHNLEFYNSSGVKLGAWPAFNNIDSAFAKKNYDGLRHLRNGVYLVIDRSKPNPHLADANGPYGSYGIIRFAYPGHSGVGVHAGRANAANMPGPQHATHGCIRTTDAAMAVIVAAMVDDALTTVSVFGNGEQAIRAAKAKSRGLMWA